MVETFDLDVSISYQSGNVIGDFVTQNSALALIHAAGKYSVENCPLVVKY